jgi:DNA ligase (NAD+)
MNPPTGHFPLSGKNFVVTGAVHHYKNRDELKTAIEAAGGKVTGSVSKNTDYLINNDVSSTSGKNKKAKDLDIPIISEEEFLGMLRDN